jgi:hypothetical protein
MQRDRLPKRCCETSDLASHNNVIQWRQSGLKVVHDGVGGAGPALVEVYAL